ncbi:hypothetical protein CLM62_35090 [Streptomyces sp. SA15]|nr:hypothetical protein CLM62_35090 [Streptomyces sp. SA15]
MPSAATLSTLRSHDTPSCLRIYCRLLPHATRDTAIDKALTHAGGKRHHPTGLASGDRAA